MRHKVPHSAVSRHGIYHFRLRVHACVRHACSTQEIRRSLETGNAREAAILALRLRLHYYSIFLVLKEWRDVTRKFTPEELAQLTPEQLAQMRAGGFGVTGPSVRSRFEYEFHDNGSLKRVYTDPTRPEDGHQALEFMRGHSVAPVVAPTSLPSVPPPQARIPLLSEAIEKFLNQVFERSPINNKAQSGWNGEKSAERVRHLDVLRTYP